MLANLSVNAAAQVGMPVAQHFQNVDPEPLYVPERRIRHQNPSNGSGRRIINKHVRPPIIGSKYVGQQIGKLLVFLLSYISR